jgi:cystathionine beta-lyase/cystathionine gamma-synthase
MTAKTASRHAETLALHGGLFRSDPVTGAVVPPVYLTTSYQFRDSEHARRLFALEELGYTTRAPSIRREKFWSVAWRHWREASPLWHSQPA